MEFIPTHPTCGQTATEFESRSKLTIATLRPKWFLISPSLKASGHSSLIMEKSCLIPIFAVFSAFQALVIALLRRFLVGPGAEDY